MKPESPWYKHYGKVRQSLEYSHRSISGELYAAVSEHTKQKAIIYFGESITYERLWSKILETARALSYIGVKSGDRVAVCLPNIPQAVYLLYAIDYIGAVASFIHPLSSVDEFEYFIQQLRPASIVILDTSIEVFEKVFEKTGEVKTLVTSPFDELSFIKRKLYNTAKKKSKASDCFLSFNRVVEISKNHHIIPIEKKASEVAVILFSGGTTGVPKGVMLSSFALNAMAYQTVEMCSVSPKGKSMLSLLPLFHGFGLCVCIHTPLIHGATCILIPRFKSSQCGKIIKKYRPNFIAGVPTIFEAILREKNLKNVRLTFLSGVFSGGDKLPEGLKAKFDGYLKERGAKVRIREGYGLTECVTASCLTPVKEERIGSVGLPFPDTFYKICDVKTGDCLKSGNIGEICISGPTLMTGYLNNPEETAYALRLHSDGRIWLHTGDAGYIDKEGFVYFTERIKRIIVSSGYNVYPSVLEKILLKCPLVKECCVVGVEDNYRVEKVKAFIVPQKSNESHNSIIKRLRSYCTAHISKYAVPREIEIVDTLPRTNIGKVSYISLSK